MTAAIPPSEAIRELKALGVTDFSTQGLRARMRLSNDHAAQLRAQACAAQRSFEESIEKFEDIAHHAEMALIESEIAERQAVERESTRNREAELEFLHWRNR